MFTVGPRFTLAPLPNSSVPITWPYCCASDGSQVAASVTPAGSWVTPVSPSATPAGPSSSPNAGMHNEEIAGVKNTYGLAVPWPSTMLISWLSDIWLISCATRWEMGAVEVTHGHELPAAGLARPAVTVLAAAAGTASN